MKAFVPSYLDMMKSKAHCRIVKFIYRLNDDLTYYKDLSRFCEHSGHDYVHPLQNQNFRINQSTIA